MVKWGIRKETVGGVGMATDKGYLDFVLDQLSGVSGITHRQMMGEYILYREGRITAYLCDNRLLVKPTASALALMPTASRELPYEGAKEMLLVDRVDDRDFLKLLFDAIFDELPEPEPRKRGAR